MSFKDFIIDSIKYSLQNKTNFLIFGLLLIVLAFLPEDVTDIDPSNLMISLPMSLITFFLIMIQAGYLTEVLMEIGKGSDIIPKFRDIRFYIIEGIKDWILGIYYVIIPFSIIGILEVLTKEVLGDTLYVILALLMFVSLYLFLLMLPTAILYTVIDNYKKAFNLVYIFKRSREIGFKRLNFVLLVSVLIFAIISSIRVTNNDPVMSAIFVIVGFILYPILTIMDLRYLALIGREIMNKK